MPKKLHTILEEFFKPGAKTLSLNDLRSEFSEIDIDQTLDRIQRILSLSIEAKTDPMKLVSTAFFITAMYQEGIVFSQDTAKEKKFRDWYRELLVCEKTELKEIPKHLAEIFKQEPRVKAMLSGSERTKRLSELAKRFKSPLLKGRAASEESEESRNKKTVDPVVARAKKLLADKDTVSEGITLLHEAVELKNAAAAFELARIYEKGIYVEKDPAEFELYLSKAIEYKSSQAMFIRAALILKKDEHQKDIFVPMSTVLSSTLREKKGIHDEDEKSLGIKERKDYAIELLREAASLDNVDAIVMLYNLLQDDAQKRDISPDEEKGYLQEAIKLLDKGVFLGDIRAMNARASLYRRGLGGPVDELAADTLLKEIKLRNGEIADFLIDYAEGLDDREAIRKEHTIPTSKPVAYRQEMQRLRRDSGSSEALGPEVKH